MMGNDMMNSGMRDHWMMDSGMCSQEMKGGGMMGKDRMGSGMMSDDMRFIHQLFANHDKIRRSIEEILGGVRTVTESDDS